MKSTERVRETEQLTGEYPELRMLIEQGYAVCGAFVIDNSSELSKVDQLNEILTEEDEERPLIKMNAKGNTVKVILRYPPQDGSDPGDLDLRVHYKNILDGGGESTIKHTRASTDKALSPKTGGSKKNGAPHRH